MLQFIYTLAEYPLAI